MPENDAIQRLRARHEDYDGPLGCGWWQLVRDACESRGGFRVAVERGLTSREASGDLATQQVAVVPGSYLRRFPRETAEGFAERQRVSFYRNHLKTILSQYQGHLWRRAPERDAQIANVSDWWGSADGQGTPIAKWLPVGARRAEMYGWAVAYFDRPRSPQSLASARTAARWLQPEELVDWQLGADGQFKWARLCTVTCLRDPFTGDRARREHYTTWTRDAFQVDVIEGSGADESLESSGPVPHALGAVPLAVLYWQAPERPEELYGTSHLDSAVAAALELFNVSSEARHVERGTAFPILYAQSKDPKVFAGLKLGVNNGIVVEPGVSMAPGFIAPPADISAHFRERRAELKDEIYESANLDPPASEAAPPESGIARAYKFIPKRSVLVDACEQLARFERRCVEILARWDGVVAPEGVAAVQAAVRVTYPTEFDVQDADAAIERSVLVVTADAAAPVTKRAARVQLGRAVAPNASAADEAALLAEADAIYRRELATLTTDPAAPGKTDPAAPGANGGGNGPAAGA